MDEEQSVGVTAAAPVPPPATLESTALDRPPVECAQPLSALGVLFVHGIGSQTRGQTLTDCASEVIDWWRAWAIHEGSTVNVERTVLALEPARYQPAYTHVAIKPGGGTPKHAVLAESWWAADFSAPGFRELTAWMLTFGSWIVISHLLAYSRAWAARTLPARIPQRALGAFVAFLGLAVSAVALFLVQILLLLLGILAVIPVPGIRRWVADAVLALEGLVGDSYAFSANPIANSAVTSRVRRDLDWLIERCEAVVVVAHSQGAAIAVRALEQYLATPSKNRGRLKRLITYGSGVVKLTQLEEMTRPPRRHPGIVPYLWLIIAITAVAVPYVVRQLYLGLAKWWSQLRDAPASIWSQPDAFETPMTLPYFIGVVILALSMLMAWWLARAAQRRFERARSDVQNVARLICSHVHWTDIYASSDPVPNGPVFPSSASAQRPASFTSRRVTNTESLLRDHVTYWRNTDEFVTTVASEINEVVTFFAFPGPPWFEDASVRRHRRISRLILLRRLTVAALAISAVSQASWFTEIGASRIAPTLAYLLPDFVAQFSKRLAASSSPYVKAIVAAVCFVLGTAVLGFLGWACFRLPKAVWDYWDRDDVHRLLSGDSPGAAPRRCATALFGCFFLFVAAVSARATGWGYTQVGTDLVGVWGWLERRYATLTHYSLTTTGLWVWRAFIVIIAIEILFSAVMLVRWLVKKVLASSRP